MNKIKKALQKISKTTWILIAIIILGIFLRTYQLHNWLYFYPDQARDLMIVDDYLGGRADLPLLGFKAASSKFQLGAMYSYFQIIAAKIFGSSPAVMAYPDVLFGILSIPLLYLFLKKYFDERFSLALTGLYSISFYAIRYSRFAWNSNPIPFFVLLFLLALWEFLVGKEKTAWRWIVALGIALGVGVQLHTVLLILLPLTLVVAFGYYFAVNQNKAWQKWLVILLVALVLNIGQIISETRSGFKNTKYFVAVLGDRSPNESVGALQNLALDVICNAQANSLYVSSFQNKDECDSLSYLKNGDYVNFKIAEYVSTWTSMLIGLGLLIFGYWRLVYCWRQEQTEKKKIFLGLNLVFGALTFLVIFPIVSHNGQVRYFLPIIFLPFLFLGLVGKYFLEKFAKKSRWLIIGVIILAGLNIFTIFTEVSQLQAKTRSNAQYVVLGELEEVSQYIIAQSQPQKEAYVFGGQKYMQNFYRQLFYAAAQKGFNLNRVSRHPEDIPAEKPIFFIDQNPDAAEIGKYQTLPIEMGFKVLYYKNFGNVAVYRITN